ncbi:DedA family protein [Chitinilyticum litopenaei]|uniref:DedA family protein n=1 Tax=Chitinilyticum litopenaei TaxID=1121276 RepID=UPI000410DCFB|nr:DedA family protein [Chitinilyticum litopenaei]
MESLFNTALAHSGELALALLFVIVLAESIALLGLLIPGTVLMIAIGTLVGQGVIDLWLACLVGFLAALLGDCFSFWLGKRYRMRLQQHPLVRPHRGLLVQARRVLRRHGGGGIFAGRFIGPTRPVLPMVAGMLAMPPRRFFPACALACLFWTPAYLLPGIFAGAAIGMEEHAGISFPMQLLLAAILSALAAWLLYGRLSQRFGRQRSAAVAPVLRWGMPLSLLAAATAVWFTVAHPQALVYGNRLWQLM